MGRYDQKTINAISKAIHDKKWGYVHNLCDYYIENYPDDMYIYLVYINILLKFGRKEKARYLLNQVKLSSDEHPNNVIKYFYATVKLLLQEEKYQDCLDYLDINDNLFRVQDDVYYVRAYCKKMLGLPIIDTGYDGYIYNQIINYSEDAAIKYICDNVDTEKETNKGSFDCHFDIEKCFHIVRSRISKTKKLYVGQIYYDSIFKADNCGTYAGEKTDFIVATGILHTDKILTMYPNNNLNKQSFIDISRDLII